MNYEIAFRYLDIKRKWEGEGVNEKGIIDSIDREKYKKVTSQQLNSSTLSESEALIKVDPQYFRPTQVEMLLGDLAKANEKLGWDINYSIRELVEDMVEGDVKTFKDEK